MQHAIVTHYKGCPCTVLLSQVEFEHYQTLLRVGPTEFHAGIYLQDLLKYAYDGTILAISFTQDNELALIENDGTYSSLEYPFHEIDSNQIDRTRATCYISTKPLWAKRTHRWHNTTMTNFLTKHNPRLL